MKIMFARSIMFLLSIFITAGLQSQVVTKSSVQSDELTNIFFRPPESAKPGVLWMWMGSNISKAGITKDLVALKKQGFNRTTMFSLADVTTPWAGEPYA
jgi:hypothetical protein